MARQLISSGSEFEAKIGYSRAVEVDGWVFVSGTTGYDYATMQMPESVADQAENALATIGKALAEAGASLDDVVQVKYILPNGDDFEAIWPITSRVFATAKPAATMIEARLMNSEMKVEIEVVARVSA